MVEHHYSVLPAHDSHDFGMEDTYVFSSSWFDYDVSAIEMLTV